jgi:hypothetical protein
VENIKSFRVLDFHVNKSVVIVERHFQQNSGQIHPVVSQFGSGIYNFKTRVAFANENRLGTSSIEEEAVERAAAAAGDQELMRWSPRTPNLTPCDFFYLPFRGRWLTRACAAQQPTQCLISTCYKEFVRNLITGLMCVVLRVEHILNICNVPEKENWRVFLSINTNSVHLRYI